MEKITDAQKELGEKIIEDTIERYDIPGSRCIEQETEYCVYGTPDGRSCALGYYLLPEVREAIMKSCFPEGDGGDFKSDSVFVGAGAGNLVRIWNSFAPIGSMKAVSLDDLLVPEVRGLPEHFWCELQRLHDFNQHWRNDSPNTIEPAVHDVFLESRSRFIEHGYLGRFITNGAREDRPKPPDSST